MNVLSTLHQVQVLRAYEEVQDSHTSNATEAYEYSEMLLYQAQLLHQAGHPQEALAHLAAKQVQTQAFLLKVAERPGDVIGLQHEEAASSTIAFSSLASSMDTLPS